MYSIKLYSISAIHYKNYPLELFSADNFLENRQFSSTNNFTFNE